MVPRRSVGCVDEALAKPCEPHRPDTRRPSQKTNANRCGDGRRPTDPALCPEAITVRMTGRSRCPSVSGRRGPLPAFLGGCTACGYVPVMRSRVSLVLVVVVLAGCGSGADGSGSTTRPAAASSPAAGVWRTQVGDARRGRAAISASPVPVAQRDHLAVLRRPQTAVDRGPEVRRLLRMVGPNYTGVRTGSVRLLAPARRDGTMGAQVLIPVERANGVKDALCVYTADIESDGVSADCKTMRQVLTGQNSLSIVREAPLTATQLAAQRRAAATSVHRARAGRRAVRKALEPLPRDRDQRIRVLRRAYAKANQKAAVIRVQIPKAIDSRFPALVPDGVATVVRTDGTRRTTAKVTNNHYDIVVPGRAETPGTITWLDAQGRTLRTIKP